MSSWPAASPGRRSRCRRTRPPSTGPPSAQQDLNSDVSAIANSAYYQCYLNSEEYLSSQGSAQSPPVLGAGTGQYAGDHPTATTAFVASYLETDIGHQLLLQLADERNVTVTPSDLVTARSNLTGQISEVMSEILQTPAGPERALRLQPDRPAADRAAGPGHHAGLVRRPAGAIRGRGQRPGGGPGRRRLERRRPAELLLGAQRAVRHGLPHRRRLFERERSAGRREPRSPAGTPFATLAAGTSASGGGAQGCDVLSDLITKLPAEADLKSLATGAVSPPINDNGTYVLLQITSRTPTAYSKAKTAVENAVQQAGATATQKRSPPSSAAPR